MEDWTMSTRVLIADDEQLARDGLRSVVAGLAGFDVVAVASNGAEAVQIAEPARPDICILDIKMPQMDGRELAEKMISLKPGLKCLFMSGYVDNVKDFEGILDIRKNFIQKPFSRQSLAAKVREVLDS